MEQSTHQVSSHLPLERFVAGALGELERLRYSRRSLQRYWTVWRHLVALSHEMSLGDEYSNDLAAQFCNAYQMRDGKCLKRRHEWRRHIVFALKVLGDFARDVANGCERSPYSRISLDQGTSRFSIRYILAN
jgi:hypothetical protein